MAGGATSFREIKLALIEEGRLVRAFDEGIQEAAKKLLAHVKKYGRERTKKSKAVVMLAVAIEHDGTEGGEYLITGSINSKIPGRPKHTSVAIEAAEDGAPDDATTLFVRRSGSDSVSPRQGKLTTDEGDVIDTVTGEVKTPTKKEG